jgi:hypothetical protein
MLREMTALPPLSVVKSGPAVPVDDPPAGGPPGSPDGVHFGSFFAQSFTLPTKALFSPLENSLSAQDAVKITKVTTYTKYFIFGPLLKNPVKTANVSESDPAVLFGGLYA